MSYSGSSKRLIDFATPNAKLTAREDTLKSRNWNHDELLACFNLYCRIPFGKLHKTNPKIVEAAAALDRTPSAVAMKLVNFASFDPAQRSRNVKGLVNVSRHDRALWEEFEADPNSVAVKSEEAFDRFIRSDATWEEEIPVQPLGPTEKVLARPMRLVQSFFRRTVLSSYCYRCSFCRLPITALLSASHIIPWSVSVELRADPRNGLCLCALHDRAFDRGLIAVDPSFCLVISPKLRQKSPTAMHKIALLDLEGFRMDRPQRFPPNPECLEHHRKSIFQAD